MSLSKSPWTVREGRMLRYLQISDGSNHKIAEIDTWGATPADAMLMAAAPALLQAATAALNDRMYKEWPEIAELLKAAIAKAEQPFVYHYKPAISAE